MGSRIRLIVAQGTGGTLRERVPRGRDESIELYARVIGKGQ